MTDPLLDAAIVLVDDEPANLRLLERFLERAGFTRIRSFGSPWAAIESIERSLPDLVMLDLHMPGMDGYGLLRAITSRLEPDDFLPLVVLTGDTDRAARSQALSGGATDFLVKPLDGEEVVLRVRNLLRTRLLHGQLRARNLALAAEVASTSHALNDLTDEWIAVASALTRLTSQGTAEATAARICEELSTLPDLSGSALLAFGAGGSTVPLALGTPLDGPLAVNVPLPEAWSRTLRTRAADGAWITEWVHGDLFGSTGVVPGDGTGHVVACVPMRSGSGLLGLLLAAVAEPDGATRLARRLPALEAFAAIASALLARDVLDRQRDDAVWSTVERSIAAGAFQPVFQPIVRLSDGRILGQEALTRFSDGVPPDRRFADAAAIGLGQALEEATLAVAIAQGRAVGGGAFLSLNVSPGLVLAGDRLPALVAAAAVPVVLEITEHVPIEDYGRLREAIAGLGGSVRFAVDDAGSGFSSFRHILELRPDFVKLDLGLVRGIDQDTARQAFVAAMTYFAVRTGTTLIAEGIETPAERAMLEQLGVGLGQGFLIGRPGPLPPATGRAG